MGLFDFSQFKDFAKKAQNTFEEIKDSFVTENNGVAVCPYCNTSVEVGDKSVVKCPHCGSTINAKQNLSTANGETKQFDYAVCVHKDDDEGFCAYDLEHDCQSEYSNSVAEALDDIKQQVEDILQDSIDCGDGYELITEQNLLNNKTAKKAMEKDGDRIKHITLNLTPRPDYNTDKDW